MQIMITDAQRAGDCTAVDQSPDSNAVRTASPVVRDALRLLGNSPYGPLKAIACEEREGALVLRGVVPTYYMKQMAQVVVCGVSGVLEIHNRLDVEKRLGGEISVGVR